MFRKMLEEAFEEFKQTVAPERPEISTPMPPGTYPVFDPARGNVPMAPAIPRSAETAPARRAPVQRAPVQRAPVPRAAAPANRSSAPAQRSPSPPPQPARVVRPNRLRAQLASRESVRSAFIVMEILRPPVALRESIDPTLDR